MVLPSNRRGAGSSSASAISSTSALRSPRMGEGLTGIVSALHRLAWPSATPAAVPSVAATARRPSREAPHIGSLSISAALAESSLADQPAPLPPRVCSALCVRDAPRRQPTSMMAEMD
eukprot:scaffold175492_cov35-Tisochrysis_lutea.AAC.3